MRLSEDMQRLVREQGLGFVATVRPDGTPSLSPKGTTSVWGDEQLVFLHLHSPVTVANLAHNPNVEVNVVDPIRRKGYRFAGRGRTLIAGEEYERILAWFGRDRGINVDRVHGVVLIDVTSVQPLVSPIYDTGVSEEEVMARFRQRHLGTIVLTSREMTGLLRSAR
jgi:uncharacterized protein